MSDRTPYRKSPRKSSSSRGRGRGGSNFNSPANPRGVGTRSTGDDTPNSRAENDNTVSDSAAVKPSSSKTLKSSEQLSSPKMSDPGPGPSGSVGSGTTDQSNATTMSSVSDSSELFCSPRGNIGSITDPESFATPPSGRDIDIDVDKIDPVFSPPRSDSNSPETIKNKSAEPIVQEDPKVSTSTSKPEKPPRKISSEKVPPSKTLEVDPPPQQHKSGEKSTTIEIDDKVGVVKEKEATSTPISLACKSPLTSPKYEGQGQPSSRADPWTGTGSYGDDQEERKGQGQVPKRPTVADIREVAASFTGRQWSCLIVFGIANIFCAMVTSLQAPFYPPEAERKGATASEYGLVFGVYELVAFLTSPIFGKYMNRLGPRLMFNIGIMTTAISCVAFGFLDQIPSHTMFITLSFVFRILEALGASAFVTSSFAILALEFPNSVATTFASLETCYGLGLIVGPSVGGALFEVGGFILPFAVTGVGLFAIGVGAAFVMPKIDRIPDSDTHSNKEQGIFSILKVPGVALATIALVMTSNAIGFLSATLEPHLRPFALTPTQIGLVFIIYGGVYAICAPFVGKICDRISKNKQVHVILLGQLLIPIAFLFIGPAPFLPQLETSVWLTSVGLVILGLGLACTLVAGFISCLSEAIKHGFPDNLSTYGVVSGLWTSAVSLGAFMGPSIGGFLLDYFSFRRGTYYIFGTEAIVVVLIFLFFAFRAKNEPLQRDGRQRQNSFGENEPLLRSISPILGERSDKIAAAAEIGSQPAVGVTGGCGYGTMGDSQA